MSKWLNTVWEEVVRPLFLRPKRVQVAALCTRDSGEGNEVLLITSRDTGRWSIPKGWPIDGMDGAETALQEAWEEAGVKAQGADKNPVGYFSYDKILKDGSAQPVLTSVYRIKVTELADQYPEVQQRQRCWVSPEVAAERVREPGLQNLLRRM